MLLSSFCLLAVVDVVVWWMLLPDCCFVGFIDLISNGNYFCFSIQACFSYFPNHVVLIWAGFKNFVLSGQINGLNVYCNGIVYISIYHCSY